MVNRFDSVEIECPLAKAAEVINIAYDTLDNFPLERFKWLELPIGCEGDVGISWGETQVVHPGVTQAEVESIITDIRAASIKDFGSWIY